MVVLTELMTSFCSNTVTVSVMLAVAMPLALGVYDGRISAFVVAALVAGAADNGWSAPPASPTAAVVYGSGWVDSNQMMKWGLLTALMHAIVTMTVGYLLGIAICG